MKKKSTRRIIIGILAAVLAVCLFFVWKNKDSSENTSGILDEIYSYSGYARVVSEEEYEFYEYFVERDLPNDVTGEELAEQVKAYANRVNAIFYLGNKLGFCEPYSFEVLKLRMEQENASRQAKKEENEVIYGVEQFNSLSIYFQYTMDNVESAIQGYLEENADQEILKMAEDYYNEHQEDFQSIVEVVYDQTIDGVTETITADAETLSFYGKSDKGLADFLGAAQVGDTYEDDYNYQNRVVEVEKVTYTEYGYENHEYMALYSLVRNELYDTVISRVAESNPVEFE